MRRRKQGQEAVPHQGWIVTFGDLTSLMLTFFILIVAISTLDKKGLAEISNQFSGMVTAFNGGRRGEMSIIPNEEIIRMHESSDRLLAMRRNALAAIRDTTLESHLRMLVIDEKLILRCNGAILFDGSERKLRKEQQEAVQRLARMLAISPGAIRIEGRADGKAPWETALARAASILHIMEEEGVDAQRLSLAGYGPMRQAGDIDNEGRNNNRVDIVLYGNEPENGENGPTEEQQ